MSRLLDAIVRFAKAEDSVVRLKSRVWVPYLYGFASGYVVRLLMGRCL